MKQRLQARAASPSQKVPVGITGNTNSNDVSEAAYDIFGRYLFAGFKGRF